MDSIQETINKVVNSLPECEGPISVTDATHPFSAMAYATKPVKLSEYGYIEEEYFFSGVANVYQEYKEEDKDNDNTDEMVVASSNIPYKNRLIIRKPKETNYFSGRVYIEIYNPTRGFDIEEIWNRSNPYFIRTGDIYIGITAKPVSVLSLKNFDNNRYKTLNWSSQKPVILPTAPDDNLSIPGTEEGLIWDMLTQIGALIRTGEATFLENYSVDEIYLCGQSQAGMYLNTYTYYFHPYTKYLDNKYIFDGYLSITSAKMMRALSQEEKETQPLAARGQKLRTMDVPYILLSTQGDDIYYRHFPHHDIDLTEKKNSNSLIRHYELPSAPHTVPNSPYLPNDEELIKSHNYPLQNDFDFTVNAIPLNFYINTCLEFLHLWATEGQEPPKSKLLKRDRNNEQVLDSYGNGAGGIRTPYIEVPIACFNANVNAKEFEVLPSINNAYGSMEYFDYETLANLYNSKEDFLQQFEIVVARQIADGFLLPVDAENITKWAERAAEERFPNEVDDSSGI